MSILNSHLAAPDVINEDLRFDESQMAAAAFLARYGGRTLDAYRHDLGAFFQWASDAHLAVLEATRPHIELYRTAMEEKYLAPSTIDRRLSTVCGFYRFAHIDGWVGANPAQYVRRPKVHPSEGRGMDRREFGTFLYTAERFDRDHAAPRGPARLERPPGERGVRDERRRHRLRSGSAPRDPSSGERTVNGLIAGLLTGGSARLARGLGSGSSIPTCSEPRSSWRPLMRESRFAMSRSPLATPIRGRRPSTTADARILTATRPMSWWPSWRVDRSPEG